MRVDPDACYEAFRTHDPRFDGRFFVGVASTGIYCRPVCRVRPPKRESCRFFMSAAAAEAAGFRPCLRCRPELAPGNGSIDAPSRLAHAAAALIEEGALLDDGLEELASRLSITSRHLRRVFQAELGVSPVEYAQTQRLLLAKRLLTDTRIPVIEVAMASGFGSLRRFNALFRSRYRLSPSELRKNAAEHGGRDGLTFQLAYRPPFDWRSINRFLAARAVAGVEEVSDTTYRRTVSLSRQGTWHRGFVEVGMANGRSALEVIVDVALLKVLAPVLARVRRLFDLSCHPTEIAAALGPLAEARAGLRVPGAFDGFEMAVRAILGQQITVKAARTMAGRLVRELGDDLPTSFPGLSRVFPAAQRIAALEPNAIAALGVPATRATCLIAVARAVVEGRLRLEPDADVEATTAALRSFPGIGEWTAQYIAMRALSWPDAFPHTDYGVRKALQEKDPRTVLALAEGWRPWRAYAVMHLWSTLEES